MIKEIPYNHPLRKLFRWATKSAFRFNPYLQNDSVEKYISEWILARFIHMDNIYKIRNASGKKLYKVAEILSEGVLPGLKDNRMQDMAIHQYVGDYVLFIAGLFPNCVEKVLVRPSSKDYLMAKIGSLYYSFKNSYDYYIHQGQVSYKKASEMMRELQEEKSFVLKRLSNEFPAYVNIMSLISLNTDFHVLNLP